MQHLAIVKILQSLYSRSSPCDHSRKRPALVTIGIVRPRLNCYLNAVIESSRKRPQPLLPTTDCPFKFS